MAVKIRLTKIGRTHRPYYRICAMDSRSPRDGRNIEVLGTYDPMIEDLSKSSTVNAERVRHWLSVGAQPSETVISILKRHQIELPKKSKKKKKKKTEAAASKGKKGKKGKKK